MAKSRWVLAALIPALTAAGAPLSAQPGGSSPAFAPQGRLAVSARGDLWILAAVPDEAETRPAGASAWRRVTTGAAWDRDPAWTPDGASVVFASDRSGGVDLYRIAIGADGAAGEPERLTTDPRADHQPAVRPDGSIVFVRGTAAAADLWELTAAGVERRLTDEPGGEVEPAVAPDGRLAWVAIRDGTRTLKVRDADGRERTLHADLAAGDPAWSPDGSRIAFTTGGRSPGVWVTPADGSRLELAAQRHAEVSWSPDAEWLVLAEAPDADVAYNGDPDRLGDRVAGDAFRGSPDPMLVRAPRPPESRILHLEIPEGGERESLNGDAFDRVWQRVADLYLAGRPAALARWRSARDRHRARALAARDDAELERALHGLLADRPSLRDAAAGRAAVSSAHPVATAAGVEILEAGGNVVDAAVAVSFALGVVEPDASGPGGYGEMLIHRAGMAEPVAIEFMTRLPEAYNASFDVVRAGGAHGALLANVPGTVAGMESAWKRYGSGRLPWARLLEPAIRAAEQGFEVSDGLATTLSRERESFARYESSRALFQRDGVPLAAGDTLRNPDLAWTLREIARDGAEAFYRGAIAERLVADLRSHGSAISRDDLRRYFAADRRPVRTTYRGHAVYSGPPPVTGGAGLVAKLNLLEHAQAGSSIANDAAKLHAMLEAWKLQPSTAGRIADPDLWPTDVSAFESKDTAAARWQCFDAERAGDDNQLERGCVKTDGAGARDGATLSPNEAFSEDADDPCAARAAWRACRNTGTTAYAVADAEGNAVSVTQTLGTWGGNFYVTPGLGFLYNDKYTSYRSDPDAYGTRLPYARNTTVISPTIVYDGTGPDARPMAALGAAGNAWITAAVYAMVVGIVDHGLGAQEALELPRMLPGGNAIQMEDGFAPDAIARLETMGHRFRRISLKGELRMGYGAAVVVRNGRAQAGADPRRSGAAGATSRD